MLRKRATSIPSLLLALVLLSACAVKRPEPIPLGADALPWGALHTEDYAPGSKEGLERSLALALMARSLPEHAIVDADGLIRYRVLALSGGGARGAFAAGLLAGWSASGERPEFEVVTGISTGGLIATFAFLGPEYDELLREIYTTTAKSDLFRIPWWNPFGDPALYDTAPFRERIARYVTHEVLDQVAAQHEEGRRLFLGSVDLDGRRFVIWDMGAIAASERPDRLQRYRDVLYASAALPGLFPPMYFPVEGGEGHQMHVDGGVMETMFVRGFMLDFADAARIAEIAPKRVRGAIYMLVNDPLVSMPEPVQPNAQAILASTLVTAMASLRFDAIQKTYFAALNRDFDYRLTGLPEHLAEALGTVDFDPERMQAVFDEAFEIGERNEHWLEEPPWEMVE